MASIGHPTATRVPPRAAIRLLNDVVAVWRCQALNAAIQLQVPEQLAAGPRAVDDLAESLACSADGLRRLLRALCVLGVCTERRDDRFALSRTGRLLCAEPGGAGTSLRPLVQWWGGALWPMWGELAWSVRTGQSVRRRQTGDVGYSNLEKGDGMAQVFHGAQHAFSSLLLDELVRWPGWTAMRSIVDVGGGHGQIARALLHHHRRLYGVVFDLDHARAGAEAAIADAGLASRCRFEAGSFFDAVPAGADGYLLKSILHNWDDGKCAVLLPRLRAAMPPHGRALVIERVRPERLRRAARDEAVVRTDLNMMAGLGGRERSLEEYQALLAPAGLAVASTFPLAFEFSVIEVKVDDRDGAR